MNETRNLKLFVSISLGLHLFVLSLFSILMPDLKITQLPRLNIEVSLLPLAREEERLKVRSSEFGLQPIRAYGPEGVRSKEE